MGNAEGQTRGLYRLAAVCCKYVENTVVLRWRSQRSEQTQGWTTGKISLRYRWIISSTLAKFVASHC